MISGLVEHVLDKKVTFGELEDLLWNSTLKVFQHVMVEVLEQIEEKLMVDRDKSRFKSKEKNPRSIQTLVGGVDFERRYYWDAEEHRWTYLLDEMLELEAEKTIGPGLLQLAVTWATKGPSYHDARDRLTDLYGAQVLSHEAIRKALLEVGAFCEREQQNKIVVEEGRREVEALFIEVDGFSSRFQKMRSATLNESVFLFFSLKQYRLFLATDRCRYQLANSSCSSLSKADRPFNTLLGYEFSQSSIS